MATEANVSGAMSGEATVANRFLQWCTGRAGRRALWSVALLFLLLRFVHLQADYPRNILWDDGTVTDEGWYASSAINGHLWHTWLLPGDMNIPVLMPVWPLLASLVFRVAGFGMVPLRVLSVLVFAFLVWLVGRVLERYGAGAWAPLAAVLLALNPWLFAFSRHAFLEFPMLVPFVAALLLATGPVTRESADRARIARLMLVGVLFALGMLLKTTLAVLAPVLVVVLWLRSGRKLLPALRDAAVVFVVAAVCYGAVSHFYTARHRVDANFYLQVVPSGWKPTPHNLAANLSRPFRYGLGSDHLLFTLGLLVLVGSLAVPRMRCLWRAPLFLLAAAWLGCFLGFMAVHNNDPPRYYAVVVPPLVLLLIELLRNRDWAVPRVKGVLVALLVLDVSINAAQAAWPLLHPVYSFPTACESIRQIVAAEPGDEAVVMADNAHELALETGERPLNALFHSAPIPRQMDRYRPGWYVQFHGEDEGNCLRDVIEPVYRAEARGRWTIFYPGKTLTLYRLTRRPGAVFPPMLTAQQTAECLPAVALPAK